MTTIVGGSTPPLRYLQGYPADTLAQVGKLLQEDRVADWLLSKYPLAHTVRTDRALFDYVQAIKAEYLRSAEPLSKVAFDAKLHIIKNALAPTPLCRACKATSSRPSARFVLPPCSKPCPMSFCA